MPRIVDRPTTRWLGLALAVLLSACGGTRGGPIAYNVPGFASPDAPKPALDQSSAVAAGDLLTVTIFQADALSRDYRVDPAGNIVMPLIGQVAAVGQTTAQLQQAIRRELSKQYMQNPDVTVTIKESISRTVTVDGSVKAPGVFPIGSNITLLQAVALAQGVSDSANRRRVAVFRTVGGQRMAAAFDLTEIRRGQAADPTVYPGDIVVVDGSGRNSAFRTLLQTLPLVALFRPF